LANNDNNSVKQMNMLLKLYYDTIIDNIKNNIPKIIMYFMVNQVEQEINLNFYEKIMSESVDDLLEEEDNISLRRKELRNEKERLNKAKKSINNIL
jgi:hypothetical protein